MWYGFSARNACCGGMPCIVPSLNVCGTVWCPGSSENPYGGFSAAAISRARGFRGEIFFHQRSVRLKNFGHEATFVAFCLTSVSDGGVDRLIGSLGVWNLFCGLYRANVLMF